MYSLYNTHTHTHTHTQLLVVDKGQSKHDLGKPCVRITKQQTSHRTQGIPDAWQLLRCAPTFHALWPSIPARVSKPCTWKSLRTTKVQYKLSSSPSSEPHPIFSQNKTTEWKCRPNGSWQQQLSVSKGCVEIHPHGQTVVITNTKEELRINVCVCLVLCLLCSRLTLWMVISVKSWVSRSSEIIFVV